MSRRKIAVQRASADALAVLGHQIRMSRIAQGWTQHALASRIGVTQKTVAAIESGAATVTVGSVFNAAFTVGVNLFGLEGTDLALARRRGEETLALLPSRIRRPVVKENADDFAF